ncbi:hypothetical protein TVAG_051350 [Trichomonas vaginalis G3]|uniref:Uncharacterized protein n=1 Tax=Trichomonas vaginalis (strain ATCC PRA-98 / G3) TaxID=412133 RepID=A2FZQ7_TRIV3|nr:hypothetical protein TVAG_051350 [Trichomonas vaginalis G3]|eukprot:XP_001302543.1 hypothetical protein [Trichomonas vaginalis G3]
MQTIIDSTDGFSFPTIQIGTNSELYIEKFIAYSSFKLSIPECVNTITFESFIVNKTEISIEFLQKQDVVIAGRILKISKNISSNGKIKFSEFSEISVNIDLPHIDFESTEVIMNFDFGKNRPIVFNSFNVRFIKIFIAVEEYKKYDDYANIINVNYPIVIANSLSVQTTYIFVSGKDPDDPWSPQVSVPSKLKIEHVQSNNTLYYYISQNPVLIYLKILYTSTPIYDKPFIAFESHDLKTTLDNYVKDYTKGITIYLCEDLQESNKIELNIHEKIEFRIFSYSSDNNKFSSNFDLSNINDFCNSFVLSNVNIRSIHPIAFDNMNVSLLSYSHIQSSYSFTSQTTVLVSSSSIAEHQFDNVVAFGIVADMSSNSVVQKDHSICLLDNSNIKHCNTGELSDMYLIVENETTLHLEDITENHINLIYIKFI